jgi:diguanylate cyclase (GGDEF)-like protein
MAVMQRDVTTSLDRMQWVFLIVTFSGFVLLLWQLRRSERLYEDLRRREADIRELAALDPLTGLSNRRHFDERMKTLGDAQVRTAHHLLLIDLDGFKRVNDQYGHEAGDHLLKELAQRFRAAAGNAAIVARLGGDEFAILTPASPERACELASVVIGVARLPVAFGNEMLRVGASVGIAAGEAHEHWTTMLLRNADVALYKAKAKGRNCYCIHETVNAAGDDTRNVA